MNRTPPCKPQDRHDLLLPVVLSEQIIPGSFSFALDYLVDPELGLSALADRTKTLRRSPINSYLQVD